MASNCALQVTGKISEYKSPRPLTLTRRSLFSSTQFLNLSSNTHEIPAFTEPSYTQQQDFCQPRTLIMSDTCTRASYKASSKKAKNAVFGVTSHPTSLTGQSSSSVSKSLYSGCTETQSACLEANYEGPSDRSHAIFHQPDQGIQPLVSGENMGRVEDPRMLRVEPELRTLALLQMQQKTNSTFTSGPRY